MKQVLCLLLTVILLSSCQKENVLMEKVPLNPGDGVALTTKQTIIATPKDSTHTFNYRHVTYDSCTKENILVNGTETDKLTTLDTPLEYLYSYTNTLSNVTAIGMTSSMRYVVSIKATGYTDRKYKLDHIDTLYTYNRDGSIDTTYAPRYLKTFEVDSTTYNASYISSRGSVFTLTQKDVYREVNGVVVKDSRGNPLIVKCN